MNEKTFSSIPPKNTPLLTPPRRTSSPEILYDSDEFNRPSTMPPPTPSPEVSPLPAPTPTQVRPVNPYIRTPVPKKNTPLRTLPRHTSSPETLFDSDEFNPPQ